MTIHLNNRSEFARKKGDLDYFDWEIFIDESSSVLNEIEKATYFLHKTYPEPVRTTSDSSSAFSVRSRGWGEFDVGVHITYKDGRTEKYIYRLDLSKPWGDEGDDRGHVVLK